MKEEDLDKDILHVLDQMINPAQMSESDVRRILANPEEKELARDIHLLKDTLLRSSELHKPDVDAEWAKFSQRPTVGGKDLIVKHTKRRSFFIGATVGIAASLVFAVTLLWNTWTSDETVVFRYSDVAQHPMLFTSTGSFDLSDNDLEVFEQGSLSDISITDNLLSYNSVERKETDSYDDNEIHILQTPIGQDFKVQLSDGTIVWLNAESRLEYPSHFSGSSRMVYLTGEAYFKVAHDEEHPFMIQTQTLRTKVLGTEFNISSYSDTNSHVTLVDGSLEVSSSDGGNTVRLVPGQDALLNPQGSFSIHNVDTDNYYFWKEGYFYYDNVPLIDIMQNIGRWYNVNVVFLATNHINDRMHIFCSRKDGLENVIQIINGTRRVKVNLEGKTLFVE